MAEPTTAEALAKIAETLATQSQQGAGSDVWINISIAAVGAIAAWVMIAMSKKSDKNKQQEQQLADAKRQGEEKADKERIERDIKELWDINTQHRTKIDELLIITTQMGSKLDQIIEGIKEFKTDFRDHLREKHNG